MASTALYTDTGRVAQALAFQSPETLNNGVSAGATSIMLSITIPSDWTIGSTLILDVNNPSLRETVTITGSPSGNTIPVSAVLHAHAANSPVVNGTLVSNYISAASRWFDTVTYTPAGFAYETYTDQKTAYLDNDGYLLVPLSKPLVNIQDVVSVTFQSTPLDTVDTLNVTQAWIQDNYFLKIAVQNSYCQPSGMAVVSYSGGFNPVPDDISQCVTVMAARMYKQRDSGYSDVIGSPEMGTMQYSKAMPADMRIVVNTYTRWTV